MLERASACLETGGRRLLRNPKPCLRSRRTLHSSFWHHGASDLSLPSWWASVSPPVGDATNPGRSETCSREPKSEDGQLLDFLYPEMALALIRRTSNYSMDATEVPRRHQMHARNIRHFSTSGWKAGAAYNDTVDLEEMELQTELGARLIGSSASDELQTVMASGEQGKQELAWRLYQAIPEPNRTPVLQADLLEYLAPQDVPTDAKQVLKLFDALPREDRRASSIRIATSAYISLEMVDPAMQLHEEATSATAPKLGLDIGTHILLGRTVRDNQWALSLRVMKAFMRLASRNSPRHAYSPSQLYWDERHQWGEFKRHEKGSSKILWGTVAQLPYLRGNLEAFLLHIKQFRHEVLSTEEDKKALNHFLLGLSFESTEQMMNTNAPDEKLIWDSFVSLFHELHVLGLSSSAHYDYTIQRILQTPRYQEYTNQRKIHLQLYRMYRGESEQSPETLRRPSPELISRMIFQVGKLRSTTGSTAGVENLINDLRNFYPEKAVPCKTLKYLIRYYADSGQVDQVQELFEELRNVYKPQVDLHTLMLLPYVCARRVDVLGTEKQFNRISEEFGMTPDTACWNVLLLVYTRADDLDAALACFNKLVEASITPDIHTFGPLLDLCASRGDVEAYEAIYSRAEQLKIPVRTNVKARASYVQALLNFGDPDGAEQTALTMLKNHQAGTLRGQLTHTWNLLIQYHAVRGNVAESRRLYQQMVKNKIPLDTWTYASLMRALVEVRQTNAAYKIMRVTMPSHNIQVHAFHYALVITGFVREGQYEHALRANKRMQDRSLTPTSSSRMASLQAIGVSELLKLKEEKNKDPKTCLIAIEESLRDILLADYQSEVAVREPRHFQLIDSRQNTPDGYFGFLITLYGTRGAFDRCKELFAAAAEANAENANYEAPISLLTAVIETHYRAGEYVEVAECWKLARVQAAKLVKTVNAVVNPPPAEPENDSLIDPSIQEKAIAARIARNRRQILFKAARFYIRSLASRKDIDGVAEARRTMKDLLVSGFVVDNITWNEFIQTLARRGHLLDAFTACEAYLIPSFPGWRDLNPNYTRKDLRGHLWMELRHTELHKGAAIPRYRTLVILATAYAQVRQDEGHGIGYDEEMGKWTRELLVSLCPLTIKAIETMPRTGDALQKKYLSGLL